MIALTQLDLKARTALLHVFPPESAEDAAAEKRLRQTLMRLGVDCVQQASWAGAGVDRQVAHTSTSLLTMPGAALVHGFHLERDTPVYRARCPHRRDTLEVLGL